MDSSGNRIVDAVGRISITGNIIPQNWYKTITYPSGKPYLAAIVILADIVYWYRPTEIRDERSGQVIAHKKRFKADLLQRSYADLAEQFGISKREATNAVTALEHLGVVKRHLRTIEVQGNKVGNVLFIELIPDVLRTLTFTDAIPLTSESEPSHFEKGQGSLSEGTPLSTRSDTNTETTQENTQENTTETIPPSSCGDGNDDSAVRSSRRPTREDVRQFCYKKRLCIDPDHFFDENERRGWLTKEGKPVDNWQRYALTWNKYETASATSLAKKKCERQQIPSVEDVMKDYQVNRTMAERLIQEGLC